jgi:hypothetical protein
MIESSLLLGGGVEIENLESDLTCRFNIETVRRRGLVVLADEVNMRVQLGGIL